MPSIQRNTTVPGSTTVRTPATTTPATTTPATTTPAATSTGEVAWASNPQAQFGKRLAYGGRSAILERTAKQDALLTKRGVGAYYGDHSTFARMTLEEKKAYIKERTPAGVTPANPNELRQTSCIDWALENVVAAYEKAGRGERGREIAAIVARPYVDPTGKTHDKIKGMGGVLMRELQKDGWTSLFWAKDSKNPDSPGSDARKVHQGYINMAKGEKKFWVVYPNEKMRVDDYVMDYNLSEDSAGRATNSAALEKLSKIPFAIGVAKGGTHCFTMHDGVVSENHWTAGPDAKKEQIFQETPLKDWSWSSGLVMVPPGSWTK